MKILIYILSFITLTACNKNDNTTPQVIQDQLPPITTTGVNTAGCMINGKVIVPKNGINGTSGFPVYGLKYVVGPNFGLPNFNDTFSLTITNLKDKGVNYWIYIHINDMTIQDGIYNVLQSNGEFLNSPNNPHIIVRETFDGVSGKTFISGPNSGIINITRFDYNNKIISGLFNCTLYNKDNSSETIQVTEGRFDINLLTLNQ
ncbi:DUF5025 domain-containing protein [Flavobacterium sp.]|uniref:DUF5025 domain-containing protein n=1 Tax=Flavobacterium sp. TaxID=239 RepID=UPI00286D8975|nr:DUF5025 domain-containing protein [Flavobacterium sp.]